MNLRNYQKQAYRNTIEELQKHRSTLIVCATGLGKTIIFSHISKSAKKRVLVLAHREELITQAADKIHAITGEHVDIEMAGQYANRMIKAKYVVGTVQTLCGPRLSDFLPEDFGLIIVDEAHHSPAKSYGFIIDHFKDSKILGVTATPDRADEKALGKIFDSVAFDYGIYEGVTQGWLVPVREKVVYVKSMDLSAIKTVAGDFNSKELAQVMEYEKPLHEVAYSTMKVAGDKKTLIFASSVHHAVRICEILNRHESGCAQYVTGKTPKDTRRKMLEDFKVKNFQYLVNVGVATEGFDDPNIEVVSIARPTKSRALFCQMLGRGTRPHSDIAFELNEIEDPEDRRAHIENSDKPTVTILDFVGNAGRHKLISATDALAGNYDDDIVVEVKERVRKATEEGKEIDLLSELKKVEQEAARRRHEQLEAAKRGELKLKVAFSLKDVDPFDLLGIVPQRLPGYQRYKEPTEAQAKFLARKNIDTKDMHFVHASQLIGELKERMKGLFPWGKHEGTPIAEVNRGYLSWFVQQTFSRIPKNKELREECLKVLGRK